MMYQYECPGGCGEWEEYRAYADRNGATCPKCGAVGTKLISTKQDTLTFTPAWFDDICETPIYITSKKQLRDECKKHDVVAARLL